ncbi:MAG: hypothetical protein KDE27_22235 [Planctomycetes bacterium]|nr:hypothetical protein [Planctomycetota bacterium]
MKRAIRSGAIPAVLAVLLGGLPGQGEGLQKPAQPDVAERLVAEMLAAEQRLRSVRIELSTASHFPGDTDIVTAGTLHVLRGEQPKRRVAVRMEFGNGLVATMDSVETDGGVTIYKDDPAFGEVFLRVPPAIVTDLRWAGEVLDRSDLPGMRDARADAPLGSALLDGLRREFALAPSERAERGGERGTWLAGKRRPGIGEADAELPLADRVELFVRASDHALLEVKQFRGDEVILAIDVAALVVDADIPETTWRLDGRGQTLREIEKYVPLWSQIQDVIRQAERKLAPADAPEGAEPPPESLRPSKRGK